MNGVLDQVTASRTLSPQLRDALILLGIAAMVAVIVAIFVFIAHKSRRQQLVMTTRPEQPVPSSNREKGSRRKRFGRNPTLAQTGGLPPVRRRPDMNG